MAQPQNQKPQHPTRLVRATKRGFDNVTLREPGEEFMFSGPPGSWFEDVPAKQQRSNVNDLA